MKTPVSSAQPAKNARQAQAAQAARATESDPRWEAVQQRDRSADGQFFYAVRSTGVFCRPSCSSRQP